MVYSKIWGWDNFIYKNGIVVTDDGLVRDWNLFRGGTPN
jgi:hypothetical protein